MPDDVEVIVPWRGGEPDRERNWAWLRSQWQQLGWPVTEAPGSDPWCKAEAVGPALRASRARVVVVADADVLCAPAALREATGAVLAGQRWAIPHFHVRRLSNIGTDRLLATGEPGDDVERPYVGIEGGGIVIGRRDALFNVPLDPRFVGWGQEDESWGMALRTLIGPPWRGEATLLHLHHRPQLRMTRRRGSMESWALRRRYLHARGDAGAMRTLIGEAHAHAAADQAVPGRA